VIPANDVGNAEHERIAAPIGDRDPPSAAINERSKHSVEELFNQTAASGAERKSHRHFHAGAR